jgi:hypothetical protein
LRRQPYPRNELSIRASSLPPFWRPLGDVRREMLLRFRTALHGIVGTHLIEVV